MYDDVDYSTLTREKSAISEWVHADTVTYVIQAEGTEKQRKHLERSFEALVRPEDREIVISFGEAYRFKSL